MLNIVIIDSVGQADGFNVDPGNFARKVSINSVTGERKEICASDFAGIPYLKVPYTDDLFEKGQKRSKSPILELEFIDGVYAIKK